MTSGGRGNPEGAQRGRPTSRQAAEMEDRLLDAAWALLAETGPEHLSIDRLAARARASKKTIYARYANKRDLLGHLLAQRLELFLADMADPAPADGQTAREAFSILARGHLAALVIGQGRLLERLVDWLDSTVEDDTLRDAKARSYARVLAFLEWQIPDTARRVGFDIPDPDGFVRYWLDGIVGHSRTALDCSDAEIERWAAGYTELFLKAAAAS
jgi:TetR/AcrR family transcriptional repressor of mexJK operon